MHKQRIEFFKVKWKGISPEGNTWEPASHFQGEDAKAVLAAFRKARAEDMHEHDQDAAGRRAGIGNGEVDGGSGADEGGKRSRSGTRRDTGSGTADVDGEGDEVAIVDSGTQNKKQRQNRSDVWKFFYPRYWDTNGPSGKGYYAKCRLCQYALKVSNTTNLRGHLDKRHAGHMVEDAQTGKKVNIDCSCYDCNQVVLL